MVYSTQSNEHKLNLIVNQVKSLETYSSISRAGIFYSYCGIFQLIYSRLVADVSDTRLGDVSDTERWRASLESKPEAHGWGRQPVELKIVGMEEFHTKSPPPAPTHVYEHSGRVIILSGTPEISYCT
jgi:hypothetical protein